MAETNATILIPDISGFTEFMTTTELAHSSFAINMLIDAIITAVGEEYEVSEIEGDAVLLIRKGPPPTQQQVMDICLKIFNAFHYQRKWMQQYTVCPCGACRAVSNLTLKFVVHHGPLAEIRVGKFTKQSGTEMIVAHRLLKNSIDNHEYLLVTEKLLDHQVDKTSLLEMEWNSSFEEYPSIGKVQFRYTSLAEARKLVPDPPVPVSYEPDDTRFLTIPIAANFQDVYMTVMNIPGRPDWVPGLQKVEQDQPAVFIGSVHLCTFDDLVATVSPIRMNIAEDGILYAERCSIQGTEYTLIHEYIFNKKEENSCVISVRCMNAGVTPLPASLQESLAEKLKAFGASVKALMEKSTV
ncbi:MAG: DUF2652 domain-containing protein [Ferruginibacter sp.]|nr:DUF2652 domain-containing protein [Ferruginibacter sp.]